MLQRKFEMKKSLLIKLHLYAGIFTSFYLLAFGFSSLVLNHQINVEQTAVTKTWETTLLVDTASTNLEMAEYIRDQLGIMGWLPRWEMKRDQENFRFTITHPGRKYNLILDIVNSKLSVEEMPKGFLAVFHGLHFLNGKIPNAPLLIHTWAIYQWLALFTMAISMILGIWLWLKYSYKTWQGIAFGVIITGTIILMILV